MGTGNHNVEIVVHVDDTLGEQRRSQVASALAGTDGIYSAEFCPLRYHLMLVKYDREGMSSQDVLHQINKQEVHAELIGPV